MSIDRYYTLGRTGLRVSRLALGTMTFGTEWGWGADEASARQLFDAYLDAGGNLIDTADLYTSGTAETWLGRFIADRGARDRVVLATKYGYTVASVIVGATSMTQLHTNMQALTFTIPDELSSRLEQISRPEQHFPYSFFGPEIQGMIHGGKPVGSKPSGYAPEVAIEGSGAGVE